MIDKSCSEKYDVIVTGAGVSGVLAAVAAARSGAKVLMLEKYGFSGGVATAGLMACFNAFRNEIEPNDFQAVKGYPQEVVDRLIDKGGASGHKGRAPYCVPFSTEILKSVFDEILEEAGVDILYHALVTEVVAGNNRIVRLVVNAKDRKIYLEAAVFVDATGDADIAAMAGAPYEIGTDNNGKTLSVQMMFKLANIHVEQVITLAEHEQERYGTQYHLSPVAEMRGLYQAGYPIGIRGFKDQVVKALGAEGDIACIIHKGEALFWGGIKQGEKSLITADNLNALDIYELTKAEIKGRKIVWQLMKAIKQIPGFAGSTLTQTGAIGVRETRRILGRYQLTEKDALEGARFDDVIAIGINPIPSNNGRRVYLQHEGYDIPFRCLLPQKVSNLIVTGRCMSADHLAFQSSRSMATAMAVGQAAGTAAALAGKGNTEPGKLEISKLQKALLEQGVELGQNRKATRPFSLLLH
jgi:hypothetical protein